MNTLRRKKLFIVSAVLFCVGILMPGFLLFGWTRDIQSFLDSATNTITRYSRSSRSQVVNSSPYRNSVKFSNYYDRRNLSALDNFDKVLILGETPAGIDQNVQDKRDFIRQVGLSYKPNFI